MEQDETLAQDIETAFAELGLTPAASEAEIKAAWRRLVSKWHPDRNPSAAASARMQRLNRAVEAIRQAGFPRPGAPGTASPAPAAAAETPAAPGRTINRKVKLTLEDAAFGCTRLLQGKLTEPCAACEGAGTRVLAAHCAPCGGAGAVRERGWFGWTGPETECPTCRGDGRARQPCAACAGAGKTTRQRYQLTVRFPHGVRDGDVLGVKSPPGWPGVPPVELNIQVQVLAHALFTLEDDGTVLCEMPVDGFAWVANQSVEVPTLGGLQTLALHRERRRYRLQGQGFPAERRGARADQVVTVTPVFPQRLSRDQQLLLDRLAATTSGPDAKACDERLRVWRQAVGAWKRRGR